MNIEIFGSKTNSFYTLWPNYVHVYVTVLLT
jgi:hypothetical protein